MRGKAFPDNIILTWLPKEKEGGKKVKSQGAELQNNQTEEREPKQRGREEREKKLLSDSKP